MRQLIRAFLAVLWIASAGALAQGGAGQFFKDEGVVLKVVAKLQFHKQLLRENIDVKANGGIVTLSGNVSSHELVTLAGKLAAEVSGVTRVHNLLQVGATTPRSGPGVAPSM